MLTILKGLLELDIIGILLDLILSFLGALVIALFITGNIGGLSGIKGPSMEPNFYTGNMVLVNNLIYRFRKPKRRETIVLNLKKKRDNIFYNMYIDGGVLFNNIKYFLRINKDIDKNNLLKRVIAIEGDILDIKDGKVFVNDLELIEPEITTKTYTKPNYSYPMKIPKDKVFVLGDNRENSLDSRNFGPIYNYQIKGKIIFKIGK